MKHNSANSSEVLPASPSIDRGALRRKLETTPNFAEHCLRRFYEHLFDTVPGALTLFNNPAQQHSMFRLVLDMMIRDIEETDQLNALMRNLGQKHRMKGIAPVHMAAGRSAFLAAILEACPRLEPDEQAFFGTLFDQMTHAMDLTPHLARPSAHQ